VGILLPFCGIVLRAILSIKQPMEFKERVREAADIVQVIGEVVRLKPMGPNRFVGLCPFHQEKTPSFHVHRDRQFFHCFGCNKGGDVFRFVEEIEGVGFFDALKSLAERYGIPLPQRHSFDDAESRERAALMAMQEIALRHFRESLGADARAYLARRSVSDAAIEMFALGYAQPGSALVRLFEREGFSPEQMAASGLIVQRDDGSLYDRFRNRLMFPIHNEQGKPIAFGGRAIGDDEPKYLNSSDTKLYTKKRVLFNLHRAKETIRRQDFTILVEGYMDVIGLHQAGVTNSVASCGTALSEEHARALRRHSDRIVINFDPDSAGANAAERSIRMLLEESMRIRVLALDGGLDPDEFVTQHGAEEYRKRLDSADSYFHWLAARARLKFDMRTAEGRMEGFRELLRPALERVPDKLERLAIANDLAQFIGVEPRAILDQLKPAPSGAPRPAHIAAALTANEELLIRGLLDNPALTREIAIEMVTIHSWRELAGAKILDAMFTLAAAGDLSYEALHARLSEADQRVLAAAALADKSGEEIPPEQLLACVQSLRETDKLRRQADIRERVRSLEREGRYREALELMSELHAAREGGSPAA
jgi:DNA primase